MHEARIGTNPKQIGMKNPVAIKRSKNSGVARLRNLLAKTGSITNLVEATKPFGGHSCRGLPVRERTQTGRNPEHDSPRQRDRSSAHRLHEGKSFRQRNFNESPIGKTMAIIYLTGFWVSMLWIPASAGMTTKNREK